ncbi:MAG: glycosyltransferase family 4 protein [Austwickia sp.]|nr:glycosyltransferase family 4 protein [Actinomycetota bacterium]MCB1254192.1 glycosyltransferase family 4 protein [Austwickia sp.]MCO5311299.1 glycosyltransferase family 4 protein [Austwickia sp.]
MSDSEQVSDAHRVSDAVAFIVPDPAGTPSGGHTYNDRILRGWEAAGHPSRVVTVAGSWPHPDEAARAALAEALHAHPVTLVDGLIGACCPQQIQDAVTAGHRVVLLVHLPLADETGLRPNQARDLEGLERWAAHSASAVLATSKTAAADLQRRHDLPHVAAVPPGAQAGPIAPGSLAETGVPRIGVLASVTPRKNQSGLVEALALLAHRDWTAEFVGPQPDAAYADAVRRRIADLGLGDRISLPGVLDAECLEGRWAGIDLMVLPSLHETFGLVVTEALAHGIPAVVSRGTGAVEALTGTPCAGGDPVDPPGAVVDPRSTPEMAAVLGAWLDDAAVRTAWRDRALARRDALRPWSEPAEELWALIMGEPSGDRR